MAFGTAPDGLLLASAGDDQMVLLWDPFAAGSKPLAGHTGWVDSVAFGTVKGDGQAGGGRLLLASGGGDCTVRVWDPLTGDPIGRPLTGHADAVRAVAFGATPKGRLLLASASDDTTVRVWDPLTGTPVGKPLAGHTGWVASVAFGAAPDGRPLLASGGGDKTIRVWDVAAGRCVMTLRRRVTVLSLAMTGLLLAVGDDDGLSVIEPDPSLLQSPRGGRG
ncbi:MAG TPA: hypothetical protein VGS19_36530 [Streptosporangiaceae bacterium]|nr:hypothetical protein [Streptosporangiaceae bacterium]